MPFDMASSRPLRSLARALSDDEVKKFSGLSRAELTFMPVARRFSVWAIKLAVFCRDNRICRTPALRVISGIANPFLVRSYVSLAQYGSFGPRVAGNHA